MAPAAGVNKSEHTKTFSRGYQCGDGVADAACHWLHLQSITQPGRAGLPCSPPEPRGADVLGVEAPALIPMERNAAVSFLLLLLCGGLSVSVVADGR